jgi:ATP-binding cassette subfamily G (WHITE) protein 2 (SNQ2)
MLFLFTMAIVTKAWFRTLAAACKSEAVAQTLGGITMLIMAIYTGERFPLSGVSPLLTFLRLYDSKAFNDRSVALVVVS